MASLRLEGQAAKFLTDGWLGQICGCWADWATSARLLVAYEVWLLKMAEEAFWVTEVYFTWRGQQGPQM